ncbi:MAG: rhomboid family intramembrane serine protease [Cryomorphaceae bacterium]|nr:rhomboid family intramembrane serine protease [Cryomorphaceae bacterium]
MNNRPANLKELFINSDALTRLILVNVGVFLLVIIFDILGALSGFKITGFFVSFTALPTDGITLLTRPWTFVTYMFLHTDFMHILFNMLWLYFGGMLFREFLGNRRLLGVYLMGGLSGGFLYVLIYNISPAFSEVVPFSKALGASASVMAILVGIATFRPRYPVQLFFVLRVPLWGVAVFAVLLDLLALRGLQSNPGGHIAHLGGAIFGFLYVRALMVGRDWTDDFMPMVDWVENLFTGKRRPKMKTVHRQKATASGSQSGQMHTRPSRRTTARENQARMDEILDKISRSGYNSLSKEEKEFLFKISKEE